MVRSSQKEQTLANQESLPTPTQPPQERQVSLVDPVSRVPQPDPYADIVIDVVESRPAYEPAPQPVVSVDDNGTITIK